MAKLNVKVIGEVIEWKGEQYRKVEREAAVGDVVQANETMVDVTYGAYYEVTDVEDGEFSFTDDEGDSRDRSYDDEDFVVFEKLTEAVAEPTTVAQLESSDLFTYENVQYRKVNRRANVGERVLVVEDFSFGKRGDVAIVTKSPSVYDDVETDKHELMNDTRYVVLEPVVTEVTYVQDGATYRPTVVGEKPTHFIRKPDAPKRSQMKSNKVYGITRIDRDGDYLYVDEYGDGSYSLLRNSIGLVRVADPTNVAKPKPARVPVGAYVKVERPESAFMSLPNGTIGKVTEDDRSTIPYRVDALDGNDYGWYEAENLTVLSEDDANAAVEAEEKRQQTETARKKWAAIGRKVNEYKTGDVVEIVRNQAGDKVGTITEIIRASQSDTGHSVANKRAGGGTWLADSNAIKLVSPVEQRFDGDSRFDSAC